MSHYSAFLRPHHGKTTNSNGNSSSSNNENDENSTIKNLIFKHISKAPQSSINPNGTMRGILGEVGNMTLNNKPIISKPKIIQQQNLITTLTDSKSIINIPTLSSTATIVNNKIEEILLDEDVESLTEIPVEFDCDSGDLFNITTVSEFVVDICKYWRELEQRTPIRQNFLFHRREGRERNK
jgi:hypothetical protein